MILAAKRLAKQELKGLRILTPKQILQRLPIALAQIKAGNNYLYQSKEITKKVYNNIIKSIKI